MYTVIEKIVGINYYPHQSPVKGDVITFTRDPFNPYDPNAIHAFDKNKDVIGFLNREAAARFSPLIDQERLFIIGEFIKFDLDWYFVNIYVEERDGYLLQ